MIVFKVWDELNGDLENADEIEATNPEHAAEMFAENDHDGHTDGLYHDTPQPISVQDPDGVVHRFEVQAEQTTHYFASPVT